MEKKQMALMLLLKAFRQEKWAEEFLDGCLYCNTLRFYQEWDERRLRDEQEGVITISGSDIEHLRFGEIEIPKDHLVSISYRPNLMDYIYIFCMYCWAPPWIDDKRVLLNKATQLGSLRNLERYYGPHTVMLRNPKEFMRRITQAIEQTGDKVEGAKGDVVKYEPMLALPTNPKETIEAVFHKDSKYIGEQEYRFAFLLKDKQPEPFRLNIGNIRDIAKKQRTRDVYDSISVNGSKDF